MLWEVKVVWGTWARRSYVNGSTVIGVLIRPGMAGVTGLPARVGCAESCSHAGRGGREGAERGGGKVLMIKITLALSLARSLADALFLRV